MKVEVRELPPAPPPKEYVLTLTEDEMTILAAVCGKIGGHYLGNTIRQLTDAIYSASCHKWGDKAYGAVSRHLMGSLEVVG